MGKLRIADNLALPLEAATQTLLVVVVLFGVVSVSLQFPGEISVAGWYMFYHCVPKPLNVADWPCLRTTVLGGPFGSFGDCHDWRAWWLSVALTFDPARTICQFVRP